MKVIDLLNKIAKGEEVPEKIKFNDTTYIYYERVDGHYHYKDEMGEYLDGKYYLSGILNHEVEIIEEDKEIEEIEPITGAYDGNELIGVFVNRLNKVIKAVNSIKKGN